VNKNIIEVAPGEQPKLPTTMDLAKVKSVPEFKL
jgi:hypothetical protein